MVYIYTLKLKQNKYYVGKTSNPNFRIESHFNSEGSEWTKMYKPEKLLEIIDGDDYDEDKYTKMYMDKYGIDNVRGGSYTSIILDKETKTILLKIVIAQMIDVSNAERKGILQAIVGLTNHLLQNLQKMRYMRKLWTL
jgi:hypothetical protein